MSFSTHTNLFIYALVPDNVTQASDHFFGRLFLLIVPSFSIDRINSNKKDRYDIAPSQYGSLAWVARFYKKTRQTLLWTWQCELSEYIPWQMCAPPQWANSHSNVTMRKNADVRLQLLTKHNIFCVTLKKAELRVSIETSYLSNNITGCLLPYRFSFSHC